MNVDYFIKRVLAASFDLDPDDICVRGARSNVIYIWCDYYKKIGFRSDTLKILFYTKNYNWDREPCYVAQISKKELLNMMFGEQ